MLQNKGQMKVGVVGAGVIGRGVAQNLAQTNHAVILIDVNDNVLAEARGDIYNHVRLSSLLRKTAKQVSPEEVLAHITLTTDYNQLREVDFVVENVVEKWEVKEAVYKQLDRISQPDCILGANTSTISITRLGAVTNRPDRVIGIHFMNPVPLKSTVEMVRGFHTSEETITRTRAFLEGMGKNGVLVNDMPGFVSNRVLMLMVNEAICLVQDQVATAAEIDKIFKECFEHKMGPLETADLIGLDTVLFSIESLFDNYQDGKYRPCPLLKKMVHAGLHGRKSGRGFYEYPASQGKNNEDRN